MAVFAKLSLIDLDGSWMDQGFPRDFSHAQVSHWFKISPKLCYCRFCVARTLLCLVKRVKKEGTRAKGEGIGRQVNWCCFRAENMDRWKRMECKMWNLSCIGGKKVKLKVQGGVLDNMECILLSGVFQGKKVALTACALGLLSLRHQSGCSRGLEIIPNLGKIFYEQYNKSQ